MSAGGGRDLYGRDTISRCDTYSNPYDLSPSANLARKQLTDKTIGGPDELEGDSARLERQLIEKFQKNQFSFLKSEKLGGVMTGGKFLLLAVAMPAYLFFYGIPRWLIQNTMNPAIALGVQAAEKIQAMARFVVKFSQDIFALVTNNAEGLLSWNKGSEGSKQSMGFIQWSYEAVKSGINNRINNLKEKADQLYKGFISVMSGVYHFLADPVIQGVQRKIDQALNAFNAVKNFGAKAQDFILKKYNEGIDNVVGRYKSFVDGAKSLLHPVTKWAVQSYQSIVHGVTHRYNRVVETANDIRNWTVSKAKEVIHNVSTAVREKTHQAVDGVRTVAEAIAAPFIASATWVQGQAVNLLANSRQIVANGSEYAKKSLVWLMTKGIPAVVTKLLPKWLNPMNLWKDGKRWNQAVAKYVKNLGQKARRKMIEKVYQVRGKIDQFFRMLMNAALWVWKKVKAGAIRFYQKRLSVVLSYLTPKAIARGFKNTVTFFRVVGKIAKQMSQEFLSDITS